MSRKVRMFRAQIEKYFPIVTIFRSSRRFKDGQLKQFGKNKRGQAVL